MNFIFTSLLSLTCLLLWSHTSYAQTDNTAVDNVAELTEAFDNWMLRAYEGDRDAQFKVALMFSDGTGTEQDIEQAVYWYIQAARQGLASAQYNLGHKYLNGEGVKKDVNQAIDWWLKAAKQEHELAQFNVARAYYGGIGVEKNVDQAHYWFRKAAANNEPRSEKILASIFLEEPGKTGESLTTTTPLPAEPELAIKPNVKTDAVTVDVDSSVSAEENTEIKSDGSIAIYNRPDINSMMISIIPKDADLTIVKSTDEWLQVNIADGFPVWVHRDFVNADGNVATITGNNVNARAVPLVLRGSVVGQLFKGTKLTILETQDDWIRLQSSENFSAWIQRSQMNPATTSLVADSEPQPESPKEQPSTIVENTAKSDTSPTTSSNEKYTFKNARNDNDWLFGLSEQAFTIQLASFSADAELNKFLKNKSLINDPNVKQFISIRNGIEWKYLLYGSYASKAAAEDVKQDKKFKNAWIRKASKIRKNRCIAWKTILPTPTELKTYCQN